VRRRKAHDYMRRSSDAVDGGGPCTAIGHASSFGAENAGAHERHRPRTGEDFDDTFEGRAGTQQLR
jgi:hypothetical protein